MIFREVLDLFSIFHIVNFILIMILAALLYKNRDKDNQRVSRVLFAVVLIIFVVSLIF